MEQSGSLYHLDEYDEYDVWFPYDDLSQMIWKTILMSGGDDDDVMIVLPVVVGPQCCWNARYDSSL